MDTLKQDKFSIFSVLGIEIEYMVVDKATLNINPIVDDLFIHLSGKPSNEIECGSVALNNELALHVLELKTNGPCDDLIKAQRDFDSQIGLIQQQLDNFNSQLMPTGMHPWLNPLGGIELWPHGDRAIYETYNSIFDCKGHGWSNLQSVHINMPFANEDEFVKLHNAIRLILPITPALFASTPICESKRTDYLSTRMMFYLENQKKIPSITGDLIPEYIAGFEDYHQTILKPMYQEIHQFDPNKILQEEWLNSRAAIARFDRDAIEIRVVDTQECNLADFTVVAVISGMIRYIVEKTSAYIEKPLSTRYLKEIMLNTIKEGMAAELGYKQWIEQFGLPKTKYQSAKHLLSDMIEVSAEYIPNQYHSVLEFWLSQGNLAERLLKVLSKNFSKNDLKGLYSNLCDCLNKNELFAP